MVHDEEIPEIPEVDAGDDVVIEAVQYDCVEAASRAYHKPDAPVVMPLELEDAPTTPPPSAAMSAPREPKEKRGKQTQHRARTTVRELDGDQVIADAMKQALRVKAALHDVVSDKSEKAEQSEERPAEKKAEKPARDPVAESFLHTYGGSSSYQTRSTGTRY